jgi:nicotinate-nucleotide adenylyltransferase
VAETALAALRLHAVWLMVSPGNPLKDPAGLAPFAARLASARAIARPPRLIASDAEARIGERYTARSLARLQRMFPRARFVFVIGADNLAQLPRWRDWRRLARRTPIAVLPRPGWTRRALAGAAARRLARWRRPPGALLAGHGAHAPWCWIPAREHAASATAIRARLWRDGAFRSDTAKAAKGAAARGGSHRA